MFKKTTKFFVGVAMLVQSLSSVIMFFITLGKKKSSGAWLALATITGAAGGYLVYESKKYDKLADDDCDDCLCDEDCDNCPCDSDCDNCPCDSADDDVDIDESELFSRNDESEED